MIANEGEVQLSKRADSRLLDHLGLSPQRPSYKSYKQDPEKIEKYLKQTFPEVVERAQALGAEICFVDEAAVRSDVHRDWTWGKVGETPVVRDSGGRFGLQVISAVMLRGDMRSNFIEGKMNSSRFIPFVKIPRKDAGRPVVVIPDNARYHHSKQIQKFIDGDSISTAFLPAYSPALNPDEQVWNNAKARLPKHAVFNAQGMRKSLSSISRSIQKQKSLIKSFKLADSKYIAEIVSAKCGY